jgi:hypothetical protein
MHLVADQLMSSRKSEKEKRLCAVPFAVIPSRAGSQGIELDTQAPVDDRLTAAARPAGQCCKSLMVLIAYGSLRRTVYRTLRT